MTIFLIVLFPIRNENAKLRNEIPMEKNLKQNIYVHIYYCTKTTYEKFNI